MNPLIDSEIEEAARAALLADTRVDVREVDVCVEDGTVFLTGAVDSAAEREAALEDVRAVHGIKDVVDGLVLRNYVERTNDELREAVRHALVRDIAVGADRITVEAASGQVTLSGTVDSHSQKNAAEDVAWWTPGVTNVVSQLRVEDEIPADLKE